MKTRGVNAGFTLLELLVVVGLIAALSVILLGGLAGGGKSAVLHSAQASVANLVTAARIKALANGQSVRIAIHIDPGSKAEPSRFLRYLALQTQVAGGWQTTADAALPDGIYILPGNFSAVPAGLFGANAATPWRKADGSALRSTALRDNQITLENINSQVAEQWVSITIAAAGTTAQAGDIILAAGRRRAPGSYAAGESPVALENPEQVCGLSLSAYGVPVLVNSRGSF